MNTPVSPTIYLALMLSLAGLPKVIQAAPRHPGRLGRHSQIRFRSRNARQDELAPDTVATTKGSFTGQYSSYDLTFGFAPFHVIPAAPRAGFNYSYTNQQQVYRYSDSTSWGYVGQLTPYGCFKFEAGNYQKSFFGFNVRFFGGVGTTTALELEYGRNINLAGNSKWTIRPSLAYSYSETKIWFPDEIDNHEKDAVIFGKTFPYYYSHGRSSGHNDWIKVGVHNVSHGARLKLGIARNFSQGLSCQLNAGYSFYFGNRFEMLTQSKATHKEVPLDSQGLDFSLGSAVHPNNLFSYQGAFVELTVSFRMKEDYSHGRHHRHHYYR